MNWRIMVVVVFVELNAKGVMFTKTVLLQLCVLCIAVFHKFYISTAIPLRQHPPTPGATARIAEQPGAGISI